MYFSLQKYICSLQLIFVCLFFFPHESSQINHPRLKSQSAKVKSSTPKNQKYQRQSFVSQVLSSQLAAPCSAIKSSQKYSHDMTIDTSLPAVWQRQQSNVGFGASCVESGAAAAALISPHSRSFCGVTSNNENITVAPASSRKSVSFSEAPGSRRALFGDSDFKVKTSPQKGQDFMSGITSEMEDDGHSTTPGFARIKSIPRTSAGINRSETEESSGAESSGKSVDVSRLSTQVEFSKCLVNVSHRLAAILIFILQSIRCGAL